MTSLTDDPAFDYMWPKRHEFPEDNFFFWQLQLKEWLYNPKQTILVMVLDVEDHPVPADVKGVVIPGHHNFIRNLGTTWALSSG